MHSRLAFERGDLQPINLVVDDLYASEVLQQREDTAAARNARRLVVARDNHQRRVAATLLEIGQVAKGSEKAAVGRAHGVEQVACNQHQVGFGVADGAQGASERLQHIVFALVHAVFVRAAVGAIAQMHIAEVRDSHRRKYTCGGTLSSMGLLPTRYLSVAGEYAGAVHIPLAELERRTHELPPPEREVWVVADSQEAYYALGWLHARGRRARLVSCAAARRRPYGALSAVGTE
jgi:hypothetical protein